MDDQRTELQKEIEMLVTFGDEYADRHLLNVSAIVNMDGCFEESKLQKAQPELLEMWFRRKNKDACRS